MDGVREGWFWDDLNASQNHPSLTPSMEKLSSKKLVPGVKKVGDCCSREYIYLNLSQNLVILSLIPSILFFIKSLKEQKEGGEGGRMKKTRRKEERK